MILNNIFRLSLAVIFMVITSVVADSNLDILFPYNCSTVRTCWSLRLRTPSEQEEYGAEFAGYNVSALKLKLTNKIGNELLLIIEAVQNQMFRVIVEEPDEHRYKLEYSLAQPPNHKKLTVDTPDENSISAHDEEGNRIVVYYKPFYIKFFQQNTLVSVFHGNKIIFENDESSQAFTFAVEFNTTERFMGLHEHADYLKLRHTADYHIDPYRLRNTDYGMQEYVLNTTRSMYGSIPVIYSFGRNLTSGIFHNNAAEQWVDIDTNQNSVYFMVDGGRLDLFFLLGPSLTETVRQYVDLTGKPHLPQLWALGYHQCRWAYNTTEDVMETIENFDKYDFPLDVLWLDIEYTSERQWFTWNQSSFPDPIELLNWVDHQGGRKLVLISDPHIKVDPNYKIYTNMLEQDLFVKDADGESPFVGECWPGNTSWVDYMNPAARDYYANLHLYENFPSTSALGGFWNDMNEPTLFDNLYERTFPFDTVHYGGVKHRDVHNIYGMLQTMSTHQGLIARDEGKLRPFILSRAYFAGSQRYASKWSGDNWGEFEDLRFSVPMTLTSNLVGLAFYGADIPGFFGNATEELIIRWYELGIWLPFFRAHAANGSPRREPYTFGNETQAILRNHMNLRYGHLPYWYTLFYVHTFTGDPIVRPLLYQYPDDPEVYDVDDEFLIGSDILVASVYKSSASFVQVYLPGENQYWLLITGNSSKYYEGKTLANVPVDITFIPVFYRTGSIIPRTFNVSKSTANIKNNSLELHIVPNDDTGVATGDFYKDDYESFNYVNNKQFNYVRLEYNDSSSTLSYWSLDFESNPSGFEVTVEEVYIYRRNSLNNEVSVTRHSVNRHGEPLNTITLKEGTVFL